MAMEKNMQYECRVCGRKIDVTRTGDVYEEPVYCCGLEVGMQHSDDPSGTGCGSCNKAKAGKKESEEEGCEESSPEKNVKEKSSEEESDKEESIEEKGHKEKSEKEGNQKKTLKKNPKRAPGSSIRGPFFLIQLNLRQKRLTYEVVGISIPRMRSLERMEHSIRRLTGKAIGISASSITMIGSSSHSRVGKTAGHYSIYWTA